MDETLLCIDARSHCGDALPVWWQRAGYKDQKGPGSFAFFWILLQKLHDMAPYKPVRGRSVENQSIFGEYKRDEDRVTAALLQILHYGGHDLVTEVFPECDLPSNIVHVGTQVNKQNSVPDGEIICDCAYHLLIESKITVGSMNHAHEASQLSQNRKLVSSGSGIWFIYITPDGTCPQSLCNINGIVWVNWQTVAQRLEAYETSDSLIVFLIEQFILLLEHLVFSKTVRRIAGSEPIMEDGRLKYDDIVIIVGGVWGEAVALKYKFYACQPGRYFLPAKYMAFCYENRIKYLFEIVGQPVDNVNLKNEIADLDYFRTTEPFYNGSPRKLFRLKLVNEFDPPIINDNVDKNGNRCAFTQRQRYTTYNRILCARKTSDL